MRTNMHSVRRWFDIAVLGGIGAIAVWPASLTTNHIRWLFEGISQLPSWLACVCILFVLTLILYPLVAFMRTSWRHFSFPLQYPALWYAPLLSVLLVIAIEIAYDCGPGYSTSDWLLAAIIFPICVTAAILCRPKAVEPNEPIQPSESSSHTSMNRDLSNLRTMLGWISTERPVDTPNQDRLDYSVIAMRVANKLLSSDREKELASVGLIGPYGCGKTTLLNLIERELTNLRRRSDPQFWTCRVSCWGFDDSSAALSHVLKEIVTTIESKVDSLSVRSMPDAYRKALSSGGSWFQFIGEGIAHDSDPTAQLQRLEPILKAVDARVLVAIEDADRNESRTFDQQQIEAMLHRLRGLKTATFVLSAGSTQQGSIDFAKLCDHIEPIPWIRSDKLFSILNCFRTHCLTDFKFIDTETTESRDTFRREHLSQPDMLEEVYASLNPGREAGARAILSLLRTPRTLKRVLRHVLNAWVRIHGEIDFDDLLLVNVLRYGAPGAFNFLLENIYALRIDRSSPTSDQDRQAVQQMASYYQELWAKTCEGADWNPRHALELLLDLLPNAASMLGLAETPQPQPPPQGIRHRGPTDYWNRLIVEEVPELEVRDQDILQLIEQANEGNTTPLANKITADEKAPLVWEWFSQRMRRERILPLASDVISILLEKYGRNARGDHGALFVIWSRANRIFNDLTDPAEWLSDQIRTAMPTSIRLCNDLYAYWASNSSGVIRNQERDDVRESMYRTARETFLAAQPNILSDALSRENAFGLKHLVFSTDHSAPFTIRRDAQDWSWIGPVILAALRDDPQTMVPQVACLVGRYTPVMDMSGHSNRYDLEPSVIDAIFGSSSEALYQALTTPSSDDSAEIQSYLDEARRQAERGLQDRRAAIQGASSQNSNRDR
jgi:hypothetical protein